MLDIIFLAAVAIYIFIKFKSRLGQVDEDQKRDAIRNFIKEQAKTKNPNQEQSSNVVPLPGINLANEQIKPEIDQESQEVLDQVDKNIRGSFEEILKKVGIPAIAFIKGANGAFEVIIEAFSASDSEKLKPLLSEKILKQFESAINARKKNEQILKTQIVSIDKSAVVGAKLFKDYATVTVEFISKQINYMVDKKDSLIEGSREDINIIKDIWTFKKDLKSQNPNWLVSSTVAN